MRSMFAVPALLLAAASMPTVAVGADAGDPEASAASGLSGKFELGYLATSGNTETSSLNTKVALGWEALHWRHALTVAAVTSADGGVTTAERYQLGFKSDYKFNEFDYLFVALNWEQDRFAGFDRRTSETVGYGRRLLAAERHSLEAELGAGARQTKPLVGAEVTDTIVRGALRYQWRFTDDARFDQSLVVEAGESNTYLESVSAVTTRLVGALALKASYTVKSNSEVAAGLEKTDTYLAVGIEYAFGP